MFEISGESAKSLVYYSTSSFSSKKQLIKILVIGARNFKFLVKVKRYRPTKLSLKEKKGTAIK